VRAHPDGYLNTYFTVKAPDKRYSNLCEAHELYCAGHMIEAAVAFYECTGERKLLDVMCRMADNIYCHFITENNPGYPGHPEIELALLRLYRCTGNEKYAELALHFINVRGVDSSYYIKERKLCGWTVWNNNPEDTEYLQADKPVRELEKVSGHAVRAVYLLTGMADAAYQFKDDTLKAACKRLWNNLTQCRMYITGGIGSAYEGEAFTKDYHLPNDTAYAETCAAIGLVFFARRMLMLEKSGEYGDIMEKALYNCVLAGMQLDGRKFFYVNPLEIIPGISGEAKTHRHTLPQRPKWFACACCPPNVARLLPSIAEYAWFIDELYSTMTVYSNLFIGGTLDLTDRLGCLINLKSDFPYGGSLKYCFSFADNVNSRRFTLAIRIPAWSSDTKISLNGTACRMVSVNCPSQIEKDHDGCYMLNGFAYICHEFKPDDTIDVMLDMSVKRVYSNEKVADNDNKAAIQRGPLIYCAEGADNDNEVFGLTLKKSGSLSVSDFLPDKLLGIREIYADGERTLSDKNLYSFNPPETVPVKITLVPYYTWGNRGINQMRTWLPFN
jgi:DUF1680 family protein